MKKLLAILAGASLLSACTGLTYKEAPDRLYFDTGITEQCDNGTTLPSVELWTGVGLTATIVGAPIGIPLWISGYSGKEKAKECQTYLTYRAQQDYLNK